MLSDIQKKLDPEGKWKDMLSIGRQDAMRVVKGLPTIETRYFISSLPNNAEILADSIRQHWGVENSLHWGGVSAGEASLFSSSFIRCSITRKMIVELEKIMLPKTLPCFVT